MNILVTGATGHLGSKIVTHLLEQRTNEKIIVSVRNIEKATFLKEQGVEVRHGDFDNPETLTSAFAGIDHLILVSTDGDTPTRIRQHAAAVEAAKQAKVQLIVYTSLTKADQGLLNLADVHKDTEKRIIESGIPYKILRNNWYLENELPVLQVAKETGFLVSAYGEGKVGWLTRDEFAKAAAGAALGRGEVNQIYTLSNQLATIDDLATVASKIFGKPITVEHINDTEYAANLKSAGLPEGAIPFVVGISQGVRKGALAETGEDYRILTGEVPDTLEISLHELLA